MKKYFVFANIIILTLAALTVLPERISILRKQSDYLRLLERQLTGMEENLRLYEENTALMSLLAEEEDRQVTVQPVGRIGALLTDVRTMLYEQGLSEQDFYVGAQTALYMEGRYVSETRATILAEGSYENMNAFIHGLAGHYRYIRLERIQISQELLSNRLWLTFAIYEEQ